MVVDKALARELTLFIDNDGKLYEQVTKPLMNNYAKKKVKGNFTKTLALKGILNLVEAGRKKYIKDFGSLGARVSMETKKEVAKQLYPMVNEGATFEAKRLRKVANAKKKLNSKPRKKKKK